MGERANEEGPAVMLTMRGRSVSRATVLGG